MEKISIVVAAYNVEQYIDKCINSLLNQSYSNIEILIINDASTDNTKEKILYYKNKDNRIKFFSNVENKGLSTSRNIGIKNASGKYIMFCDADDFYSKEMCKIMYNELNKNDSDLVVCNTNVFYDKNIKVDRKIKYSDNKYFTNKTSGTFEVSNKTSNLLTNAVVWNKIFKRDKILLNDISFPDGLLFESYPFYIAYLSVSDKITFLDDKLYNYRRRKNSIMANTFRKSHEAIDYIRSCDFLLNWLLNHNKLNKFKTIFINNFIFSVTSALKYSPNNLYNEIYSISSNIIDRAKINPYLYGPYSKLALLQIINKNLYFERSFKVLGRNLFLFIKNSSRVKCSFFGISIFNIDLLKLKKTYKNLIIFPKLIVNTKIKECEKFNFRQLSLIKDDKIVNILKKEKSIVFLPNPGNLGDCLISRGTFDFFEKNNINYKIYKPGLKSKVLVFGGGGLFVKDLYKHAYDKIINIFDSFEHVIMLPCTIHDCKDFEKIISSKFTIFSREENTYSYLKSLNSGADIILDYDMAFRLSNNIFSKTINIDKKRKILLNKLSPILSRIGNTARFLRTDLESSIKISSHLDLSLTFGSRVMNISDVNFATALMIAVISKYDTIVTDRLHVAIAAILLGKHIFVIDNNNNKVFGVIKTISSNLKLKKSKFQGIDCFEIMPCSPINNAFSQLCIYKI